MCFINIWATSWENLLMPYANNKGAGQLAHPCSLISAFLVRCLDSIIRLLAIAEISRLLLVSIAEQAGLCLTWSNIPKTGFLLTMLIYVSSLQNVAMESLWAKQPVVITFLRRFGWPFCRLGARQLSTLKPRLDANNVRLVGVGLEELGVEEFVKGEFFKGGKMLLAAVVSFHEL